MQEQTMGLRIAEQRKRLGLSQEALGEKMGVSRQAISKWEADGAVPEIDKLIALSKLFGVTVGWLLGVEESQSQEPREEFTESQLRMLEEIVKRYQPQVVMETQKPKRRWPKVLAGIAIAMVLIAAWSELDQRFSQYAPAYSVNNSYNSVQYQLGLLADRLDELAEGEKIVTEVSANAIAWDDRGGADITLSLVPKAWREGDAAFISVRLAGQETHRYELQWDGSGCRAQLSLPAADGYEYYYVVVHSDGAQEQQLLKDTGMEYLEEGLRFYGYVLVHFAEIEEDALVFDGVDCEVYLPKIQKPDESMQITGADWVVTVNGEEYSRDVIEDFVFENMNGFSHSAWGRLAFKLPQTKTGDQVVLYLDVQLSDGTPITWPAAGFQLTAEGWIGCEFPSE